MSLFLEQSVTALGLHPKATNCRLFDETNNHFARTKIDVTHDEHDRFESFVLAEGEKKVEVEQETRMYCSSHTSYSRLMRYRRA